MKSKTKLNKFKKIFEDRLIKLSNSQNIVEDFGVDGGDEVDQVQGTLLKSMADKLSQRDKETFNRINAALTRISNGTFGVCQDCEEPISEKRLLAIPDCESCISCAEIREKESLQFFKN